MSDPEITASSLKKGAVESGKNPRIRKVLLLFLIFSLLSAGLTVWAGFHAYNKLDHRADRQDSSLIRQDKTLNNYAKIARDNSDAAKALSDQLKDLGKKPVVNTSSLPDAPQRGQKGDTGDQGPAPSLTLLVDLVRRAVFMACPPDGNCKGPKGDKGDTPVVQDGKDGLNGQDGHDGEKGDPGAKIVSGSCDGSTATFVLDDGSSFTVENMCAVPLIPNPGGQ